MKIEWSKIHFNVRKPEFEGTCSNRMPDESYYQVYYTGYTPGKTCPDGKPWELLLYYWGDRCGQYDTIGYYPTKWDAMKAAEEYQDGRSKQ